MKIKFIGIGTDDKEYTNDEPFEDYGCIKTYEQNPTDDEIKKDLKECLLFLQFDLPRGVKFKEARYEKIEQIITSTKLYI